MDILIDLDTYKLGTVISLGAFLIALLTAMFATLDILKLTNFFKRSKTNPELILICIIPIFTLPTMSALGNAISKPWGLIFTAFTFWFFYGAILISMRVRKAKSHNKSLNTDASDAGAG